MTLRSEKTLLKAPNRELAMEKMIDGELELFLREQKRVSEPDSDVPGYFFRMRNAETGVEMGGLNLRAGYTENIVLYRGNIGFTVSEEFRGHRYSSRSCLLLLPFIKALKLHPIWLTCNVDNIGSKRAIESLGAEFVETIEIPDDSPYLQYYPENARTKLRFIWNIV